MATPSRIGNEASRLATLRGGINKAIDSVQQLQSQLLGDRVRTLGTVLEGALGGIASPAGKAQLEERPEPSGDLNLLALAVSDNEAALDRLQCAISDLTAALQLDGQELCDRVQA